jgi:hypothetical protein
MKNQPPPKPEPPKPGPPKPGPPMTSFLQGAKRQVTLLIVAIIVAVFLSMVLHLL